jgi:Pvc16 N-terminal domain
MYTALRATSQTISKFLEARFQADPLLSSLFSGGGMVVTLNTPREMSEKPAEGLSIWLYRVIRDDQRLNDPPVRSSRTELLPPPLPLRLHYLVTPVTSERLGDPETEQIILGKVLQVFYGHPILRGIDLQAEFSGTEVELRTRLEPMSLEEITRVWDALEGSYQLSVSYEVSVVNITPELEPERVSPVEIAIPEYGLIVGAE